ncbi:MAG: hypothetical protein NZ602_08230 [Thermoguttaceae bacterium]|nr:hypothetical protein [Thermoguttaceae bacterium]MDW8037268.1 hypothetical protein [Thermoguttaceae bacterium]
MDLLLPLRSARGSPGFWLGCQKQFRHLAAMGPISIPSPAMMERCGV